MKAIIQNFYNHMCKWSIVHVLVTYALFAILNTYYRWWQDPYGMAMIIIGLSYISLIFASQYILFLYDYYSYKKENQETKD